MNTLTNTQDQNAREDSARLLVLYRKLRETRVVCLWNSRQNMLYPRDAMPAPAALAYARECLRQGVTL